MAMTLPERRPTSSFSGRLLESRRLVRTGRIRRAASELANASRRDLTSDERTECASLLLTCRLACGDVTGATATAVHLEAELGGEGPAAVLANLAYGDLAAACGEHESAAAHFHRVGELADGDDPAFTPWRAGASLAMVHAGRRVSAAALAGQLLDRAEDRGDPWQLAVALRTAACVGITTDAVGALARARRLAGVAGDLRLGAQTGTDLAGLLLLMPSNGVAEAIGLLRSAEEYAAGEALWPLHGRVARLLERAGERPRLLRGESVELLTEGERRVARLAARGLTNRQIAEQLTVTIKGVEWHLSRVYRKLGIASRQDLPPLVESPLAESATA